MIVRGPILNPQPDGSVAWIPDGVLAGDTTISFVGSYDEYRNLPSPQPGASITNSRGIILPPFLDAHIHVPQHPIRGRFTEGVVGDPPVGRLLAGLNRNVFPAEGKCSNIEYARATIRTFLQDTLSQGVIGGSAYLTVHPHAAREALQILPQYWHAGLVLMNQNCPEYLRNDESTIDRDLRALADEFGDRAVITDRFAIACSSDLRRLAVKVAKDYYLRTQTHLNEQAREKSFVESQLYTSRSSYTDVYRADGLLDQRALLAHCIHMREDEWRMIRDSGGFVVHCPTSNLLLGSGVMHLDELRLHGIDYAICTDVGASPTTSMLLEMSQFILVHEISGRIGSTANLASEALFRSTLAPARILGIDNSIGHFGAGMSMSFIEVQVPPRPFANAEEAIRLGLLNGDSVSSQSRDLVSRIARNDEVSGESLDILNLETHRRAQAFESRIQRVVVDGRELISR